MACNTSQTAENSVSLLLPEKDFLNFSETTENLNKTLDAIRDVIQCRASIITQKKEKHQKILDSQMVKLDNEREEYIKKSEVVMNKMGEAKSQLMQIEHSYFDMRNKLNLEKQTNRALEERIKQLQLDSKQKNAKFHKTCELFKTVINWYKDYLNLEIHLDKDNSRIVTITFKESKKDFKGYPNVKLEMLEENRFQILQMHPPTNEDTNILKQIIEPYEIILFLNKFRKQFLESS